MAQGLIEMSLSIRDANSLTVLRSIEEQLKRQAASADKVTDATEKIGMSFDSALSSAGKLAAGMAGIYGVAQGLGMAVRQIGAEMQRVRDTGASILDLQTRTGRQALETRLTAGAAGMKFITPNISAASQAMGLTPDVGYQMATQIVSAGQLEPELVMRMMREAGPLLKGFDVEAKEWIMQGLAERLKWMTPEEQGKANLPRMVAAQAATFKMHRSTTLRESQRWAEFPLAGMGALYKVPFVEGHAFLSAIDQAMSDIKGRISQTGMQQLLQEVMELPVELEQHGLAEPELSEQWRKIPIMQKLEVLAGTTDAGLDPNDAKMLRATFLGTESGDKEIADFARENLPPSMWKGAYHGEIKARGVIRDYFSRGKVYGLYQSNKAYLEAKEREGYAPDIRELQDESKLTPSERLARRAQEQEAAEAWAKIEQPGRAAAELFRKWVDAQQDVLGSLGMMKWARGLVAMVESGGMSEADAYRAIINEIEAALPALQKGHRPQGPLERVLRMTGIYGPLTGGGLHGPDWAAPEEYQKIGERLKTYAETLEPTAAPAHRRPKVLEPTSQLPPEVQWLQGIWSNMKSAWTGPFGMPVDVSVSIDDAGGRARVTNTDQPVPVQEVQMP